MQQNFYSELRTLAECGLTYNYVHRKELANAKRMIQAVIACCSSFRPREQTKSNRKKVRRTKTLKDLCESSFFDQNERKGNNITYTISIRDHFETNMT